MSSLPSTHVLALTTVADEPAARQLSTWLVERKFAACVTRINARSTYHWEDSLEDVPEVLLLIKTTREAYARLQQALPEQHPYDLPELISLPIDEGSPAYLKWLSDSV